MVITNGVLPLSAIQVVLNFLLGKEKDWKTVLKAVVTLIDYVAAEVEGGVGAKSVGDEKELVALLQSVVDSHTKGEFEAKAFILPPWVLPILLNVIQTVIQDLLGKNK